MLGDCAEVLSPLRCRASIRSVKKIGRFLVSENLPENAQKNIQNSQSPQGSKDSEGSQGPQGVKNPQNYSVVSIIFKSFDLTRHAFSVLFLIAFVQALLIRLVIVLFPLPVLMGNFDLTKSISLSEAMSFLGFALIVLLIGSVGNSMMQAYFVARLKTPNVKLGEVLKFFSSKAGKIFMASMIYYTLMSLGMMLYILPALLLGAVFFLYIPCILFEQLSVFGAFKRSWDLAKGRFWSLLLLYIFTSLIYLFPQVLLENLLSFGLSSAIVNVAMIFGAALCLPFCNALCVTTYSYRRLECAKPGELVVLSKNT